ncbi:MAG TPA: DUF4254 domain-containing protein [Pirellulales bacterium]|nr:DUF4254 domain-containing protein [Pirellulales bacterium]
MIDVAQISALHRQMVELWHAQPVFNPCRDLQYLICEQHKFNFLLWHEEDIARSPHVGDARIAAVKRAIDRFNQQRNDATERIDDFLKREIEDRKMIVLPEARWNSETPGSVIDRLSILGLRIYHMQEQVERPDASADHVERSREKLAVLEVQREDLSVALAELMADIFAGRKRLKVYRQYKMYNDPALNPYLYTPRKAG